MTALSAQIDALRTVVTRATPHALIRAGFCFRKGEAELLKERLSAALATLETQAHR